MWLVATSASSGFEGSESLGGRRWNLLCTSSEGLRAIDSGKKYCFFAFWFYCQLIILRREWKVSRSKVKSLWATGALTDHPDPLLGPRKNCWTETSGISPRPASSPASQKAEWQGDVSAPSWQLPPPPSVLLVLPPQLQVRMSSFVDLSFKRCQNSWSSLHFFFF